MLYSHLSLGVGWQYRIIRFSALAGNLLPLWASGAVNNINAFNLFFQTQLAIKASRSTEIVPQLRWNPNPIFNYQNRSTHRPLNFGLGLMRTF